MIKSYHLRVILTGFVILIVGIGCGGSDLERAEHELQDIKIRINEIESELDRIQGKFKSALNENQELSKEIATLKKNLLKLKVNYQMLANSHKDLNEWAKKLAEGYGTGIWYIGESTYPRFVKSMASADVKSIIQELNKHFAEDGLPKLILTREDQNRIYVGVDDEKMLTQRMGTNGAASYLNAVVYSITSVKAIDCVWIEFEEGDHAHPGEYCR